MTKAQARGLAARAWCTPANSSKSMDADLAEAFADILIKQMDRPNLGLATTGQLLDELKVRAEIGGQLNYRTVDG